MLKFIVFLMLGLVAVSEAAHTYVGCFKDFKNHEAGKRAMGFSTTMIIFQHDLCEAICIEKGYEYMAATYRKYKKDLCFCSNGDDYKKHGEAKEQFCEYQADKGQYNQELMAKNDYLRVYRIEPELTLPEYYKELFSCAKGRNMRRVSCSPDRLKGYDRMGLKNRVFCFCGNPEDFPEEVEEVPDCDSTCPGNPDQMCGGSNKKTMLVYNIKSDPIKKVPAPSTPSPAPQPPKTTTTTKAPTTTESSEPVDPDEDPKGRILRENSDSRVSRVVSFAQVGSVNTTVPPGSNKLIIPRLPANRVKDDGVLIGFKVLAVNTEEVHLGIWRPDAAGSDTFSYVGGTSYAASLPGVFHIVLDKSDVIPVKAGDHLGFWWGEGESPVTYRAQEGRRCNKRSAMFAVDESDGSFSLGDQTTLAVDNSLCGLLNVQAFIKKKLGPSPYYKK